MDGGSYLVHDGFWVPVAVQVEGGQWLHIYAEGSTNPVSIPATEAAMFYHLRH